MNKKILIGSGIISGVIVGCSLGIMLKKRKAESEQQTKECLENSMVTVKRYYSRN